MKKAYLVIILSLCISQIFGQRMRIQSRPIEPQPIELKEINELVKNLADSIAVNYIIGEKALMIKINLLKELREGKYDRFKEKNELANHLSDELVAWSNDKHFRITPSEPAGQRFMMPTSYDHIAKDNYSFKKMEHLNGNIAYIKFNRFIPPSYSGSLIMAAMLFAANSDAVIIDLRDNIGGSPDTVAMLAGFFLKEPTLLTVNFTRSTNEKREVWSTLADVKINSSDPNNFIVPITALERLKNIPLYILTGDQTFSAAEMFSFSLQGHKRATIVGKNTLGGGHGIRPFEMAQGFTAFIPYTRYYHPVTNESWEVVGVKLDIPCADDDAKRVAQINILKELQKKPKHDPKIPGYLLELEAESPK